MHLCRCGSLSARAHLAFRCRGAGAVVYKWTERDGVMHFSDQPVPGAEKVLDLEPAPATRHSGQTATAARHAGARSRKTAKPSLRKSAHRLAGARTDILRRGAVPVSLVVGPRSQTERTVAWTLNGAQVHGQAPTATRVLAHGSAARHLHDRGDRDRSRHRANRKRGRRDVLRHAPELLAPQHK